VDFDIAGHVNNTVHWAVVEDELSTGAWMPSAAEIEYRRAILPGCRPDVVTDRREGQTVLWLLAGKQVLASARLSQ
jgi:acyl-ACP thioesterase